ncbi:MAG: pyridoxal phosphate-dependent aminotransferase family protein [Chitinophagales bacterium]|nr:pyridoxal phosphate-dependent aminotransferase family protein [Chitinophagales bacterium]
MKKVPNIINQKLEKRFKQHSFRILKEQNDQLVDFSSNDYLGFSKSRVIYDKAHQLVLEEDQAWNGSTGSRLLTGNHHFYIQLEQQLAEFHQAEAALVFNSGYDANIGLLSAILQRNDIVICDEYAHASIRDGIQIARTKNYKFKHNDLEDLKKKIRHSRLQNKGSIYIITESIFSMDGDSPDLLELVNIAEKNDAFLIIDEAHATGVIGKNGEGLVQKMDLSDRVFARIHTFGKALGTHGAVVLGSKRLIEYLTNFSRTFIYTTALPPHSVATILSAYEEMKQTQAIQDLYRNIQLFKTQIVNNQLKSIFIESNSAIQSCIIPGNKRVKTIAKALYDAGFDVKPILAPTVPENKERLRFCLHSFNTENSINIALHFLSEWINKN